MPAPPLYDFDCFDVNRPLYTIEQIREVNPQRFEMEQLTAVVFVDTAGHGLIGYKDITDHEFWARGHMPNFALMPGVILCEVAAQLAGFYARKYDFLGGGDFLGFGGMNEVRFRGPVFPGQRLLVMAKAHRVRPGKRAEFNFQGYVEQKLVFSGQMIGVPIFTDQARAGLDMDGG
jgi:3-hydroxyacyl-[acyl-carrier-protein] dehydratase